MNTTLPIVRLGLLSIIGLMTTFTSVGCSAAEEPIAQPPARDGAFAVVELFTSEGCSSCPPADALLGEIAEDAQRRGVAIFPISFHIDYWDNLGWRDRFSLAASTDRQQKYAAALNAQVYTPQMVVNGQTQFVGSDRDAYQRALADALNTSPSTQLTLDPIKNDATGLTIKYATTGARSGCVLNLVLVQRSASTDVPRGENAGHTLHHANIARSIQVIPLNATSGQAELKLPSDLTAKGALVIGYVQRSDSLKILAAAKVQLSKP